MFLKGPRFLPPKVPDVPGPNTYTVQQESTLDNYKRGAFLEKADRFSKDKPSSLEVASRTIMSTTNPSKLPDHTTTERYNFLHKKVDELEKVHFEDKKLHQVEIERLREDLALSKKHVDETTERLEKYKKQNVLFEARVQEFKKASISDQNEIKELGRKTRLLELERDRMSSKQSELLELRKRMSYLEAKREEELRERDRHIAELQIQMQGEKKMREYLERVAQDVKRSQDGERDMLKSKLAEFEKQIQQALESSLTATEALNETRENAGKNEARLLQHLEQHRCLLSAIAQQYGDLASQSIATAKFEALKRNHLALHLRQYRLERKLANSEGQVVELTHLIRQVKQENIELKHILSDNLAEIALLSTFEKASLQDSIMSPLQELQNMFNDIQYHHNDLLTTDLQLEALFSDYYSQTKEDIASTSLNLLRENANLQTIVGQRASNLSSALAAHGAIASRLESIQKENQSYKEDLEFANIVTKDLKLTIAMLETQVAKSREEIRKSALQHTVTLSKEKNTVGRLTQTVQKNQAAEDALRAEIDRLSTELIDVERYRDAYFSLSGEIETLSTRNQIAEEESERISKLNAEILGHNNPAQRILYVDRIRRELAEARHVIATLTREQDNLISRNDDLQHEIDMYKSVQAPLQYKSRTNVIRIHRPPLVDAGPTLNGSQSTTPVSVVKCAFNSNNISSQIGKVGDMTIDELI